MGKTFCAPIFIIECEDGSIITRRYYDRCFQATKNQPPAKVRHNGKSQNYNIIGGPYWSRQKVNRLRNLIDPMKRELSNLEQEGFNSSPIRNLDLPLSSHKARKQEEVDFLYQWGKATGDFSIYKDHTDFGLANQRYEYWVRVLETSGNKEEGC
jgi:hypothetical protein